MAFVVFATAALAVLVWRAVPSSPELDARRVVVFPLVSTIRGAEQATQGWEAALAIEAALEHTEPLRWLDGWSRLPRSVREAPHLLTPELAMATARGTGARYYITGAVRGASANPAVTLWLNDVDGDSVVRAATEAGVSTNIGLLAMRALEPLLVALIEPGREVDLTPLTRRAQGAIALTLQGDRAYRRAHFLEALDLYKRAVAQDSLMAVAAVKGAQAANWAALSEYEAAPLLEVALRADSILPPRYQAFAHGLHAYLSGQADTALVRLQDAVRQEPDWPEAWMALGEVYYHLMPPVTDLEVRAEEAFRRAVAVDSLFSPPLLHLAEITARRGDVAATEQYVRRFRALGMDSTYTRELAVVLGCVTDGPGVADRVQLGDSVGATFAAVQLAAGGARLDCAEAVYKRLLSLSGLPHAHRSALLLGLQSVLMAQGRYAELERMLDSTIAAETWTGRTLYLYDYALGAPLERGALETAQLYQELAGAAYERARQEPRWLLALLHLRHDSLAQTQRVHGVMVRVADSTGALLDRLYADAVEAHLAIARADTGAALRAFGRLHGNVPAIALAWTVGPSIIPTRILQARVLAALGKLAQADSVLELVSHREPIPGVSALPQALVVRIAVAHALGDQVRVRLLQGRLEALGGHLGATAYSTTARSPLIKTTSVPEEQRARVVAAVPPGRLDPRRSGLLDSRCWRSAALDPNFVLTPSGGGTTGGSRGAVTSGASSALRHRR